MVSIYTFYTLKSVYNDNSQEKTHKRKTTMTFRETSIIKRKLYEKEKRLSVVNLQIRVNRSPGKYKAEAIKLAQEIKDLQNFLNQ